MSRKLIRFFVAATVAAGFAFTTPLPAHATERTIVVEDGQFNGGIKKFDIELGDTVKWDLSDSAEEKHAIVPQNGRPGGNTWPADAKPSGDLEVGHPFTYTFTKAGRFFYYDEHHQDTMKDYFIDVTDPNATTTTTATPTTQPTSPPATQPAPAATTTTTSAPASSQGTKPAAPAAPAPTTTATTAKDKKDKGDNKDKKDEETTTTTLAPPPPVDLPDEAIIPSLPNLSGTKTQNGITAPDGAPEGDAIALLKSKKGNGKAVKMLIVSGLGLGVLGFGAAGYKYANRSSKYFPA